MLWKDGKLAEDERQLPVRPLAEDELDAALAAALDAADVCVVGAVERQSFAPQRLERPHNVVHGDRLSVVPARVLAQGEDDPGAVRRGFHGFREKAVLAERLVGRRSHQRVVDASDSGFRIASDDEGVEGVVRADRRQSHGATFARLRVDVVEVLEACRILQVAVHGDAVIGRGPRCREGDGQGRRKNADANSAKDSVRYVHVTSESAE